MEERINQLDFLMKAYCLKKYALTFLVLVLSFAVTTFANTSDAFEEEATFSTFNDNSERNNNELTCPIVLFIEPLGAICMDSSVNPFSLTVTIQGSDGTGFGIWSGPGIIDPVIGIFDPSDASANIGNNLITYTFIENGCVIAENTIITLNLPPDASFSVDSPICANYFSNVVSVNTPGGNYAWDFNGGSANAGNNEGPYEVSWPTEGAYTISLIVTDQNGCSSSESQPVEVRNPLAAPEIDCYSTTTEIVFSWSDVPDALGHEILLINGPSGVEDLNIYSVIDLMPGGDSVTLQVSALGPQPCGNSVTEKTCYTKDCPSLTINMQPVQDICLYPGTSNIELTANIENYDAPGIWSGIGVVDPEGVFDPNHPSLNNGPNKILVTFTEDACVYKDSLIIDVFDLPVVNAGTTDEITCANTQISLSGNAWGSNLVYNWTGPGIVSGFNSLLPDVDHPGTYYLSVTDTFSTCMASDSVIITIDNNVPLADAGDDKAITCDSASISLQGNSSSGQNFQYIWHGPGININNVNDQNPVVSIPGFYILQVLETVNNCYSPRDSVYVAENIEAPLTEVTQAIDVVNCEIMSNQLIGNTIPNGAYQWFDPTAQLVGNNNSLIAGTQGNYIYSITDLQTGCVGFDSIIVGEDVPYPLVNLSVSGPLDCENKEVILDGSNSFSGANIIYSWTDLNGGIVNGHATNIATVTHPGNYIFSILDTINNCSNESNGLVLEIRNEPIAIINDPDEIDCNLLKITLDGSNSRGIEQLNYQWINNSNQIAQDPIITVSTEGTYTLIVSNVFSNCSDTSSVEVFYNSPPIERVGIDVSSPSCYGENDGILVFDSIIGGTPSYLFSIDGGQNFVSYNQFYNIQSGIIDFIIEDAKGCQWDTSLVVIEPVNLNLNIGDDLILQMGDTLNLNAVFNIPQSQIDTIIWYPADILNCASAGDCFEVSAQPLTPFYARATLIDLNGCIVQDRIKVEIDKEQIAYVPNIFSPNGDNKNDRFTIYAGNTVKQIKHFSVYNRWGKIIYENTNFLPNDPAYGWDGTLNGKPLGPDVFVYWAEVELVDGQKTIFKGEVTLIK